MAQVLKGEIVIIDDQPEELSNLRKLLTLEGYDTNVVTQGKEIFSTEGVASGFLDGGFHQRIFIISLDNINEDPLKTFDLLSQNYPDARFGFLAHSFDSDRIEDFFAAGVDAFFTKPISAEKFLNWAADTSALAVDTGRAFTAST